MHLIITGINVTGNVNDWVNYTFHPDIYIVYYVNLIIEKNIHECNLLLCIWIFYDIESALIDILVYQHV